jgi:hypothetical protein
MAERDPEELADRLEHEADDMQERTRKLGEDANDVAQEWERKRSDPNVPGAPPPPGEEADEPTPTGAPTDKGEDG